MAFLFQLQSQKPDQSLKKIAAEYFNTLPAYGLYELAFYYGRGPRNPKDCLQKPIIDWMRDECSENGVFSSRKFFDFHKSIAPYLTADQKLQLMAYWADQLDKHYGLPSSATTPILEPSAPVGVGAHKSIENYFSNEKTGVCGNINGNFLGEMARCFGLEHSSFIVYTKDGAHVVGFIRSGDEYFSIDYDKIKPMGKDAGMACENLMKLYGGYAPFPFGATKGAVFFKPPSEEFFEQVTGWLNPQLKGFGIELNADANGSLAATYLPKGDLLSENSDFRLGVFALATPLAIGSGAGLFANWRGADCNGNQKTGVFYTPSVDFACFMGLSEGSGVLLALRPDLLSFKLVPSEGLEFGVTPLYAEGALSLFAGKPSPYGQVVPLDGGGTNTSGRIGSRVGMILESSQLGQTFANVEAGYVSPRSDFYRFLGDVDYKFSAGWKKGRNEVSIEHTPGGVFQEWGAKAAAEINPADWASVLLIAQIRAKDRLQVHNLAAQITFKLD